MQAGVTQAIRGGSGENVSRHRKSGKRGGGGGGGGGGGDPAAARAGTVVLREGTYYLPAAIVLTSKHNGLTITNYPGRSKTPLSNQESARGH